MSADVHESSNDLVSSPHDNNRLPGDVVAEPVSLVSNPTLVTDAEPAAEMYPVDVTPEDLGIRIELLGERESLG